MVTDAQIRKIQATRYKIVDLGSYKVKRALFYHEAEEIAKKETEGLVYNKKYIYYIKPFEDGVYVCKSEMFLLQ